MITLEVMDICHRCSQFEAKTVKDTAYGNGETFLFGVHVRCVHKEICDNLVRMLEKQLKGENDENS